MNQENTTREIVRGRRAAAKMIGISEVHYWRKEKLKLVPLPFKLFEGGTGLGYWKDELLAHQAARDASRGKTAA
jgi:hypothetical protein